MSRAAPIVAATAFLLAGCAATPAPSPTPAMVELPAAFALAPDERAAAQASLDALLPDDPAFAVLHRAAMADAPRLSAALARIEIARANAARARADRSPRVDYDASVTASRSNPDQVARDLPFQIDTDRVAYSAGLTARWDPDLFGALKASERAALLRIDAAGADAAAVRLALTAEIAAALIDWRTLAARRNALEQDLAASQQLARLAGVREKAGIAPGFDRLRAETQAAATGSRLAALEGERARLIGSLTALTGTSASEVQAALALGSGADGLPPVPASVPSQLLSARPDVQAAAYRLAAADAEVAAAAARRFPRFDLRAGLGLLAFALGDLFSADALVGNLGVGVAGPLLDFGRIAAEIDRAEADTLLAFEEYRGVLFTALGDAEAAYGLVAAADRQVAAAREEWRMAARAAGLAETRYRAGLDDFLTVLDARRAADQSGERAAAALGGARRARLVLWQALGGDARPSGEPRP